MLVEFSVKNFRSFKERQTFSMVASSVKIAHAVTTGFSAVPASLQSASIYGANAAGKSNLIKAMAFFRSFIIDSAKDRQEGEKIDEVTPYLFSKATLEQPSEFEIVFLHQDHLFQYGFSVDEERIHDEWLYATSKQATKQKAQTWIKRDPKDVSKSTFGKGVKGEKKVWKEATRDNALLLSTAVQLNAESLKSPFEWIQKYLRILTDDARVSPHFTIRGIHKGGQKDRIVQMIRQFDTGISDIQIEESLFSEDEISTDIPEELREKIIRDLKGKKLFRVYSVHQMEGGGSAPLDFDEESDGTRKLFELAGPVLDVLDNGYTLICDELTNSLHPSIVKSIIGLFHDRGINDKNAQLIFTGHNTGLMETMEREQLWLAEKASSGATELKSVSEFSGRKDENVERRYLGGRYGAVPSIGDIIDG